MLAGVWSVLTQLAPWMLLGMAIAGALHVMLPKGFVQRQLDGSFAVVKAVTLGVPLPLCSCGVIPAGLGLKRDGASDGASLAFLISTPQTGVDSLLVSASFLGWPFALFKLVSAALSGLVGGWLVDRGARDPGSLTAPAAPDPGSADSGTKGRARLASEHALDLLRSIWHWVALGVLVSAAINTWVPASLFAESALLGGPLALLAALALSVPLYVCATASVPVAAALVAAGMPAGAALVLLIAGPATNVATIGAVYRTFGARNLGIYLGTIVLGSLALGWAFDFLLPVDVMAGPGAHEHAGALEHLAAGVLVALMAWFACEALRGSWRRWRSGRLPEATAERTVEVPVSGMTCNGCVKKLEAALMRSEGVSYASVTLQPGRAVVRGRLDPEQVGSIIRETGFDPAPRAA